MLASKKRDGGEITKASPNRYDRSYVHEMRMEMNHQRCLYEYNAMWKYFAGKSPQVKKIYQDFEALSLEISLKHISNA